MMKLFIGNLSYDTTEEQIREALEGLGTILDYQRPVDFQTGKPRGFAFVTFETREEAEAAMEALNRKKIDGRELKVNEAEERRGGHPADRPKWVSMKVEKMRPVDDRPVGPDGKKIRYKSI
ncbi:RNA recognition motif domain-containing protein [Luteolibacter marinus]|uniref:RNA recognition motif domain-containing protein n=1 Tax=Luteolibacter marinus TaxID=2776705 RepID=UPI001D02DB1D|nr:RNA-binding protein [Luteolibacter marinus]